MKMGASGKDLAIVFLTGGEAAVDALVDEQDRPRAWARLVEFLEQQGAPQAVKVRAIQIHTKRYDGIMWTSKTPRPPQVGERRTLTAQAIRGGVGTRGYIHLGPDSPEPGAPVHVLYGEAGMIYVRGGIPPEDPTLPKSLPGLESQKIERLREEIADLKAEIERLRNRPKKPATKEHRWRYAPGARQPTAHLVKSKMRSAPAICGVHPAGGVWVAAFFNHPRCARCTERIPNEQ